MLLGLDMAMSDAEHLNLQAEYLMKEFDLDHSRDISKEELQKGLQRWVREKQKSFKKVGKFQHLHTVEQQNEALVDEFVAKVDEGLLEDDEEDQLEGHDSEDLTDSKPQLSNRALALLACLYLLIGTALVAAFSDPLVTAMSSFAKAVNISPFYVAFVVAPFASNASEFVSSLQFAAKKRVKNISLTFSQIYGAVTMNNTLGLGLFLVLIFHNSLDWYFSSEVISIVVVTVIIGIIGYTNVTFKSYMAFVVLAFYPLTILFVYVLDEIVGLK
eukprot:TRINITY_DN35006_c0_g1_i1.p1 TRINITY_DN35006_c0_g1~~TRINITY_DN35006_c0_g1_i1.p1  ORF type:complete len:291 (-),score=44.69 TRINITY_DN35006_c0_g1_i1:288-1103(-)